MRASEVYVRLLSPKNHPTWLIRTAAETAQAFWNLLLPVGLQGGALSHVDEDEDAQCAFSAAMGAYTLTGRFHTAEPFGPP